MKKIFMTGMLTIVVSLYAEVDLLNKSNIDKLVLVGFKEYVSKIDKIDATKWYLSCTNETLYNEIRNDDFALEDVSDKYYSEVVKLIDDSQSMIGETFKVKQQVSLEKYDFKNQKFPINISSKFYTTPQKGFGGEKFAKEYYTKRIFGSIQDEYALKVARPENYNTNKKFLSMAKNDAKKLLNGQSNKNVEVYMQYTIKITNVNSPVMFSSRDKSQVSMGTSKFDDAEILGHIIKAELLDTNNNVLQTYNYQ